MKDYFLLLGNLFLLGYFAHLVYRGVKEKRKVMIILFSIAVIIQLSLFLSNLDRMFNLKDFIKLC